MPGRRVIRVGRAEGEVATLAQAHAALVQARPIRTATPAQWVEFHRLAAAVYTEVAEVDRGHHHEALGYWAARERKAAERIETTGEVPPTSFQIPTW